MRKGMSELTPRQRAQIRALENLPDDQIDMSEIPETRDWSNAVRGMFYRPGEKHVGREDCLDNRHQRDGDSKALSSHDDLAPTLTSRRKPGADRASGQPTTASAGYGGDPQDYDREYCVDLVQLSAFLRKRLSPASADSIDLGRGQPDTAQVPGPPAR